MSELVYVNETEKGLSYSRLQKISCPRKFQILNVLGYNSRQDKPHFSHGHFIGGVVQEYFRHAHGNNNNNNQGYKDQLALLSAIPNWDWPEFIPSEYELKKNRTFYHGVFAWSQFIDAMRNGNSEFCENYKDYRIAKVKDRHGNIVDGIELEFMIKLPKGYTYEGHVDLILEHKETGDLLIIEIKSTSLSNLHPAMYKNSQQALGYTIVADQIARDNNVDTAVHVDYVIWKNRDMSWNRFRFTKTIKDRANFLWSLATQIANIETMKENDTFPKNGDECFNFFSPCEVYDICDTDDDIIKRLAGVKKYSEDRESEMAFIFDFQELVKRQLELAESKNSKLIASDGNTGDGQIISLD